MQTASADTTETAIGRYMTVSNAPLSSQVDLLNQTFQIHFPPDVITIGDAMRYLLRLSSYRLVPDNQLIPEVSHLLALPLPQADRTLGPLSLRDGLLTLAGYPFGLLVDPVHHLLSFRLLKEYQSLFPSTQHFSL